MGNSAVNTIRFKFAEPITNTAAGEANPRKYCFFVRRIQRSYKNRYGITHKSRYIQCTDGKGKFWETHPDAIVKGHVKEGASND